MREPDFYAVLGLSPTADPQTIRSAYRRAAREHHPDRGGSAEKFHRIQEAWEVLGSEQTRADYDRRRSGGAQSADSPAPTEEGAGFTYSRSPTTPRPGRPQARRKSATRSISADRPPVYEPPLSEPKPLNLALTSQKVHGEFSTRGLFGSGRSARRHQRSQHILEKHVLADLAAARLFNDVYPAAFQTDRKGRRRAPKSSDRVDHVLLCGRTVVLVSILEVPAVTASWDGRNLRAAGRTVALPNLPAHSKQLSQVLMSRLREEYGTELNLQVDHQHMLLAADGDLFHPVVEAQGPGSRGAMPLAAGRAIGHIANVLGASEQANVVDRRLMALLREQLAAPGTA